MSVGIAVLLAVLGMLLLLLGSMHVAFALAAVGLFLTFLAGGGAQAGIALVCWGSLNSFVLTALPLFVLMGEVMLRSGLTERMYEGLSACLARVPGRLIQTNIVSCALFAACSGSSVATAATIGTVAYPALMRRGYDRKIIVGSLAGGGTLGILIPPSTNMIVYGAMVNESIGYLFIAGIIPGLLLTAFFMCYVAAKGIKSPKLFPSSVEEISWQERIKAIVGVLPVMLIMAVVLGSIYMGVVTPTEAGAAGAFAAILISLFFGKLNFKVLQEAAVAATRTTY